MDGDITDISGTPHHRGSFSLSSSPRWELRSSKKTASPPPTDEQYINDAENRLFENLSTFGVAPAIGVTQLSLHHDNTDIGITKSITVGTAWGNFIALTIVFLARFIARPFYHTGNYKVYLGASRCSPEDIEGMVKNDILIYPDQSGRLHYLIKGVWKKSFSEGVIKQLEEDTLDQDHYRRLMEISRALPPQVVTEISDDCKTAFLKYTTKKGDTYSGKFSLNPLFRVFRTLVKIFAPIGVILSSFIGGDNPGQRRLASFLYSGLFSVVGGLFAIPYYLISNLISKKFPNFKIKLNLTATEGWSKFVRTFQTLFTAIGQFVGGILALTVKNAGAAATSFGISFWTGLIGLGGVILGFTTVPVINLISGKIYEAKNKKRGIELRVSRSIPELPKSKPKSNPEGKSAFVLVQPVAGEAPTALYFVDVIRSRVSLISFPNGKSLATFTSMLYPNVANHAYTNIQNLSHLQLKQALSISGHDLDKGILATHNKDLFRNNYARLGMMFFAAIGAVMGLVFGGCFGLNLPVMATIFSAAFSVIGGVVFSIFGKKIHDKLHGSNLQLMFNLVNLMPTEADQHRARELHTPIMLIDSVGQQLRIYGYNAENQSWELSPLIPFSALTEDERAHLTSLDQTDRVINKLRVSEPLRQTLKRGQRGKVDIQNSWDYAGRSGGSFCAYIGAAVACMINPAMALVWAPVGAAIAGGIGCLLGVLAMWVARSLPGNAIEKKASTLPWTQRITMWANIGSVVGSIFGLFVGMAGVIVSGPAGLVLGISLFGAIGAAIGGVAGIIREPQAQRLIGQAIKHVFGIKSKLDNRGGSASRLSNVPSSTSNKSQNTPPSPRTSDPSPDSLTYKFSPGGVQFINRALSTSSRIVEQPTPTSVRDALKSAALKNVIHARSQTQHSPSFFRSAGQGESSAFRAASLTPRDHSERTSSSPLKQQVN